jgi:phosphate transport system protein
MARQTFHQELREIEESVIQMAALVEREVARAIQALSQRDTVLAAEIVTSDSEVNELQRGIRSRCIAVMALQAPVARDLRELITVQLVINELERMGDHAVGIAKQTMRIREYEQIHTMEKLIQISDLVVEQVRLGIQSFVDVNVQQAREVCERDDEIDARYRVAFTELITIMSTDSSRVQPATSLLFAAHDLERIGDRVTNICEDVIYMVTGEIEELN